MAKNENAKLTVASRLAAIGGSAAFGYVTILLLQLKVMWGIWRWRDLTAGDTSGYFRDAYRWYSTGRGRLVWSPLYTWFYGMLLHVSRDAYVVTTLHRVLIVFLLALLVLALMRRLLPPAYAWLAAAWWVVLPIDFNSLYEVHLFAVIPLLLATLIVLWIPGRWGRGWCFAILLIEAVLMRNEYLLAAILFGAGCILWELRLLRGGEKRPRAWIRCYGVPLAAACLLTAGFYSRRTIYSDGMPNTVSARLAMKHEENVCQTYAFGYQQRHPDWQESPWLECRELMLRDFGVSRPSLSEAFRRNPRAILQHFAWNASLTSNGLQVLLMNAMSGEVNPDYVPVTKHPLALLISLLGGIVVLCGAYFVYRDWNHWWKTLLKDRAWGWFAIICIACVTPVIILTQRPRPSYLLAFGIFVRAAIAVCMLALMRRAPRIRLAPSLGPIAVLLLIAVAPSYYPLRHIPQLLRDRYEALVPYHQWFEAPDTVFTTANWPDEVSAYLAPASRHGYFYFSEVRRQVTPDKSLNQILEQNRVSLILVDDAMRADPVVRGFLGEAEADGWRLIASSHDPAARWALWAKAGNGNAASAK